MTTIYCVVQGQITHDECIVYVSLDEEKAKKKADKLRKQDKTMGFYTIGRINVYLDELK
jgi:hypothetical protein